MTQHHGTVAPGERAMSDSSIPLVRALDQGSLDRPVELEFEVSAQAGDAEPPVFIGLRVGAADPTAAAVAGDRLRDAGVAARVRLYRLGGAAPEAVALHRSQWVGRSEVENLSVGEDGRVPGLFATDADFASMRDAGLLPAQVEFKEFEFVFIRDTPPGRYRLVLALDDPRRALLGEKAELLIAYTAKSK